MTELTKEQWLKLGGGAIAVLKKHDSDAADLMADIPKAISLAKDMVALVNTVQSTTKLAPEPAPLPAGVTIPVQTDLFPKPLQPVPQKLVTADAVIEHIESHGVSASDKAIMDRASQNW